MIPKLCTSTGGRTVTGGERMEVALNAGQPATVIMRTVTGIAQHFAVVANGKKIATVELPGGPGPSVARIGCRPDSGLGCERPRRD